MQEESWARIHKAVGKLLSEGQDELTVLVLGSVGSGTSSTVNALLAENAADVRAAPSGVAQPAAPTGCAFLSLYHCITLLFLPSIHACVLHHISRLEDPCTVVAPSDYGTMPWPSLFPCLMQRHLACD